MATNPREFLATFDAAAHLADSLALLDLQLRRQVARLRASRVLGDDEMRGLYITDAQADALLGITMEQDALVLELRALDAEVELARATLQANATEAERSGTVLPLERLARSFGLSRAEREAVLVAIAPSLDLRYELLYAYAQNDVTRRRPRVDLVGRLVDAEHGGPGGARALFAPNAPLVRHRLIHLVDDPQEREPPLLARVVAVDERIVDWALGNAQVDTRLATVARLEVQPRAGARVAPARRGRVARALRQLQDRGGALYLRGPDGAGRTTAARAACADLGCALLHVDLALVPSSTCSLVELIDVAVREATLHGAALLIANAELLLTAEHQAMHLDARLLRHAAAVSCPLLMEGRDPWPRAPLDGGPIAEITCAPPAAVQRTELWRDALDRAGHGGAAPADLDALAERFVLGARQIEEAVQHAVAQCSLRDEVNGGPSAADLFSAARAQTGNALVTLARRLESPYRWPDLVLPPRTMQQLQEVRAAIRHRTVVLEGWGFAARHGVSRGLNILFAGSSGVGKTMAAQILAHDAELDIYRIDLSSVVSKYIGETERNLERIFVAARASNAVLFFDEADALFGKRSEIKDAHDRYANIEVSYLLQRMEDYDGVAILATNLRRNLDDAFARRLHHVVEFPQPEAADRERLWRAMLPPLAPLARDIDLAFLARQFELTGGHIRNVVLAAAFLAAEEATPISMRHLMRAVAREIQKLGRMPSRADFREHYDLIREHG